MKTIKHSFSPLSSSLGTLSLITLLNVSGAGIVWAEDNKVYRQEPISPLPQTVEVDADKAALGEMYFLIPDSQTISRLPVLPATN